jgi:hypothetical protein
MDLLPTLSPHLMPLMVDILPHNDILSLSGTGREYHHEIAKTAQFQKIVLYGRTYWFNKRKLDMDPKASILDHEKQYQEIKITDSSLIKALGGLQCVYELPMIKGTKNFITIAPTKAKAPIMRGINKDGLPFIYMIFLMRSSLDAAYTHLRHQGVTIEQFRLNYPLLSQWTCIQSKFNNDVDISIRDYEHLSSLIEGNEIAYTDFESIRLITQSELDRLTSPLDRPTSSKENAAQCRICLLQ